MNVYRLIVNLLNFIVVIALVIRPVKITFPARWKYIGNRTLTIGLGLAPLIGVLVLLIIRGITGNDAVSGIVGTAHIQPWSIIVIFFALAYLCISLDLTGLFEYVAQRAIKASKGSGNKVFLAFFLLSASITVLTSNDIVILTLTPIICYFAHYTKSDPIPFLFVQFFSSNIWSIILIIGNPTNIIVTQAFEIPFLEYTSWMIAPSITSGITCAIIVWFFLRKKILTEISILDGNFQEAKVDVKGAIYGLFCLFSCLVLLAVAKQVEMPIWLITLIFAILMFVKDIVKDLMYCKHFGYWPGKSKATPEDMELRKVETNSQGTPKKRADFTEITLDDAPTQPAIEENKDVSSTSQNLERSSLEKGERTSFDDVPSVVKIEPAPQGHVFEVVKALKRLPWEVMPFVFGMFIMVEGLNSSGWVEIFARGRFSSPKIFILTGFTKIMKTPAITAFLMCYISALACNLINNQPMTILFTRIIQDSAFNVSKDIQTSAIYALIMGSNYGANFTIIGALAGIMWIQILKDKNIHISYFEFAKYGFMVMPLVVGSGCVVLGIELAIWKSDQS